MELAPENAQAHRQLGNLLALDGNLANAEEAQRYAVALAESNAEFQLAHSRILTRLNRKAEALAPAQKAAELVPEQAQIQHHLGNLLAVAKDMTGAEKAQRKAISINGSVADFHASLGRVLAQTGRKTKAISAVRSAVNLAPRRAKLHHQLGNLLASVGEMEEAVAAQRQAISLDGTVVDYLIALSDVSLRLGKTGDAIEAIGKAVALAPENPRAGLRFGALLAEECKFVQAAKVRKKAVAQVGALVGADFGVGGTRQTIGQLKTSTDINLLIALLAWVGSNWWAKNLDAMVSGRDVSVDHTESDVWPIGPVRFDGDKTVISEVETGAGRPKLSIMIPVFNVRHEDWLCACIDSVLARDKGPDWAEIVVVDDGSQTDIAKLVAAKYAGRVAYRRNLSNLGIVGNHNNCINLAKGEFVHILHQDDQVTQGFYDSILPPLIEDRGIVAGFSNTLLIDGNGDERWGLPLERATAGVLENWLLKIIQKQRVRFPSMIVRRSAYVDCGGFSPQLSFAFDWEMWARLAAKGKLWYDPYPRAIYRVHQDSVTNSILAVGRLIDCFRAVALMVPLAPKKMRRQIAQQAFFQLIGNGWQETRNMEPKTDSYQEQVAFLLRGWTMDCESEHIVNAIEQHRTSS